MRASFAVIAPDDRWATGFLYLTNFRLIFVPLNTLTPLLPADEERRRPSVSIRLTHIEDVRLRGSRLDVTTSDLVYTFAFALHMKPIVTTGDRRGHKSWYEAIRRQLEAA